MRFCFSLLSVAICAVALLGLGSVAQAEELPMKEIGRVKTKLNGFPATISISTPGGGPLIDRSHTKLVVRKGKLSDPTKRYEVETSGGSWIVTTPYAVRKASKQFKVKDGTLVASAKMGRPRRTLQSSLQRLGKSLSRAGRRAQTLFRSAMSKTRNTLRKMTPGHRRSVSARGLSRRRGPSPLASGRRPSVRVRLAR
jgi:hypothetical protein